MLSLLRPACWDQQLLLGPLVQLQPLAVPSLQAQLGAWVLQLHSTLHVSYLLRLHRLPGVSCACVPSSTESGAATHAPTYALC